MAIKAADYLAQTLKSYGIDTVFEVAGGMITHLLDALHNVGGIRIVTVHHEQGGSFAADAYARVTGKPGVAFATSGPGATNLLTGIGSCYFDSVPGIFITGQVNTHEQRGERAIRQLGFQETDIVSMARPITKAAFKIRNGQELVDVLPRAFQIAQSGRPGPVLIDIPMDCQRQMVESSLKADVVTPPESDAMADFVSQLSISLKQSKRPLVLAGRGIHAAGTLPQFREFILKSGVPVVTSLLAVDALPFDHPLRVGFIGSYGNRWANLTIGAADLILVLGSRLDIRQTGSDVAGFSQGKRIFHVDCEPGEINNRLSDCIGITADLQQFFQAARSSSVENLDRGAWLDQISKLKSAWPDTNEIKDVPGINPNQFMHQLSKASTACAGYIADVGLHQMWAAQSLELGADQLFLTSAGMGAMGYALPAAIGASLASSLRPYVVIAGDGGFQLNIQELETIVRNRLPVKLVVMNNRSLGMIRQFQDSYFDSRYQSTCWGYTAPNFAKVAEAYGIKASTISDLAEVEAGLRAMWNDPAAPYLLQVMIDTKANAYPKIAFGKPITEMEPEAKPLDMEGT